jgi:hypothetical protein
MSLNQVAVAGLLGVAACTSIRSVPPKDYLENNAPSVVWVSYADNTLVPVAEPEIKRDTLRGLLQGVRVKIPLADVRSVQARVPNHMKTAILATTLGVATVSTMYFAFLSEGSGGATRDCTGDEVTKHPDEHPECFQ